MKTLLTPVALARAASAPVVVKKEQKAWGIAGHFQAGMPGSIVIRVR